VKIKKEYYIKVPILLAYLSPFIVAYFKEEQIKFSSIYYVGMGLSFLSLFDFKNEGVNNWIFALSIILFLLSLSMIILYFSM
jgi:predicted membrane channel-forming protein YqfA (hemolysin III family)